MTLKSALIIGGRGYLGRGLVHALKNILNVQVHIVDHPETLFDLTVEDLHGYDSVINLAVHADTVVSPGLSHKSQSWRVTVEGTSFLIDLCEDANVPLIHFSTREVHAATLRLEDVVEVDGLFRPMILIPEEMPFRPVSAYGRSKLIAEWLCAASPTGNVVRLGTPYSDEMPNEGGGLVASIIRQAVRNGKVVLHGGGKQIRDPVHVEDLARLAVLIADSRPKESVFNASFGGENLISLRELALLANSEVKIETQIGGDFGFAMDNSLVEKVLGWKPQVLIRDRIPSYAQSFAEKSSQQGM